MGKLAGNSSSRRRVSVYSRGTRQRLQSRGNERSIGELGRTSTGDLHRRCFFLQTCNGPVSAPQSSRLSIRAQIKLGLGSRPAHRAGISRPRRRKRGKFSSPDSVYHIRYQNRRSARLVAVFHLFSSARPKRVRGSGCRVLVGRFDSSTLVAVGCRHGKILLPSLPAG